MLEIGLDADPYSTFLFAMRSPKTKEKVIGRLRMFFDFIGLPEDQLEKRCRFFTDKGKDDQAWVFSCIVRYLQSLKERRRTLSGASPDITSYSDDMEMSDPVKENDKTSTNHNEIPQELSPDVSNNIPECPRDVSDVSEVSENMSRAETAHETRTVTCQNCGELLKMEPFYRRLHKCEKNVSNKVNLFYATQILANHLHNI